MSEGGFGKWQWTNGIAPACSDGSESVCSTGRRAPAQQQQEAPDAGHDAQDLQEQELAPAHQQHQQQHLAGWGDGGDDGNGFEQQQQQQQQQQEEEEEEEELGMYDELLGGEEEHDWAAEQAAADEHLPPHNYRFYQAHRARRSDFVRYECRDCAGFKTEAEFGKKFGVRLCLECNARAARLSRKRKRAAAAAAEAADAAAALAAAPGRRRKRRGQQGRGRGKAVGGRVKGRGGAAAEPVLAG